MDRRASFTGRVAVFATLALAAATAGAAPREAGSVGYAVPAIPGVTAPGAPESGTLGTPAAPREPEAPGNAAPAVPAAAVPGAPESQTRASGVQIVVAPGNWGNVDPQDIQVVLDSVASEFRPFVARPQGAQGTVKLRVVPRGNSPRVLYERGPAGEYVVQLTARDERWFQYAYQFSHELCHILSNFDHKERQGDTVVTGNQWFEESLCETASLFTLKRMAASWADHPPGRKWIGYGKVFGSYAEHLLAENHRRLPANQTLSQWYAENQPACRFAQLTIPNRRLSGVEAAAGAVFIRPIRLELPLKRNR